MDKIYRVNYTGCNSSSVYLSKYYGKPSYLFYGYEGEYLIRCYVHYRIVSSKVPPVLDEWGGKVWGPYNCVLYSKTSYTDLENYKLGVWVDGIFDVSISTAIRGNDGSMFGVTRTDWTPELYPIIERK